VNFSRCDHRTSPFRFEYKERSRVLFNRLRGLGFFLRELFSAAGRPRGFD
jgi:hypothetical protein